MTHCEGNKFHLDSISESIHELLLVCKQYDERMNLLVLSSDMIIKSPQEYENFTLRLDLHDDGPLNFKGIKMAALVLVAMLTPKTLVRFLRT